MFESVDFSPDGKLLAAASSDAPVFIWDVYDRESLQRGPKNLAGNKRDQLWQQLADVDGTVGFQAICELIAHPEEALTILQDGWQHRKQATKQEIEQWLQDLDNKHSIVRERATTELKRYRAANEETLRKAREQTASPEVKQRLDDVLGSPDQENFRRLRMLEVLEQIGTPAARRFLQSLAQQVEDGDMAKAAAAGLRRLESSAR